MSSSVHIDNKNKDTLILDKGLSQALDDTTLTTWAMYLINFTQLHKKFVLSLHYDGSNIFLFINVTKIYQFKIKPSEIKDYALCLVNISKYFTINDMKKTELKGIVKMSSVDFNPIDTNDILDIRKHLIKRTG